VATLRYLLFRNASARGTILGLAGDLSIRVAQIGWCRSGRSAMNSPADRASNYRQIGH
jgi:hypothetical protein